MDRGWRERLLAAMVMSCAERGFEATTVAHVIELSGASRAAFYDLFANKHDCFMAALDDALRGGIVEIERRAASAAPGAARAEAALLAFAEAAAAQPAAARACLVDPFAAGPEARSRLEAALAHFEALLAAALAEVDSAPPLPPELVRAMAGGISKVFQTRVSRGEAAELPELAPHLAEWLLAQEPPPSPLRQRRRPAALSAFSPSFARSDPAERVLRALATCVGRNGYPSTTIAQIAAAGNLSQRTFYECFAGKEEAAVAALDSSGAQMLAATMPAIRRAEDWPGSVHNALAAMCGFMAAEPDFARLRAVEAYAIGPRALEVRDSAAVELLGTLLAAAPAKVAAKAEPLLLEAIAGSIYALLYDCVTTVGAEQLPRIAPLATYLTLAPLLGAEQACEAVNEDGRRRARA